jgi:hypothetical protein
MVVSVFFFGVIVYVCIDGIECHEDIDNVLIYTGGVLSFVHAIAAICFGTLNWIGASGSDENTGGEQAQQLI